MEMLTAKTPEMVRKELWTHLFAYTLLRALMWEAEASDPTLFNFHSNRKTAVQSNDPVIGNDGIIASNCIKFCWRKLQLTCCLFDPIALNPG